MYLECTCIKHAYSAYMLDKPDLKLSRFSFADHEKHAARRNDKNKPCLLKAINYNGLFFFLLSNLLTGIINFSVHTLYATPMQACALITVYMAVSSSVTMTLYYKKVQLKFWWHLMMNFLVQLRKITIYIPSLCIQWDVFGPPIIPFLLWNCQLWKSKWPVYVI